MTRSPRPGHGASRSFSFSVCAMGTLMLPFWFSNGVVTIDMKPFDLYLITDAHTCVYFVCDGDDCDYKSLTVVHTWYVKSEMKSLKRPKSYNSECNREINHFNASCFTWMYQGRFTAYFLHRQGKGVSACFGVVPECPCKDLLPEDSVFPYLIPGGATLSEPHSNVAFCSWFRSDYHCICDAIC